MPTHRPAPSEPRNYVAGLALSGHGLMGKPNQFEQPISPVSSAQVKAGQMQCTPELNRQWLFGRGLRQSPTDLLIITAWGL